MPYKRARTGSWNLGFHVCLHGTDVGGPDGLPIVVDSEQNPNLGTVFQLSKEEEKLMDKQWTKEKCNTLKVHQHPNMKHTSAGVMAAVYNCGICCSLNILWGHESLSQGYLLLKEMFTVSEILPECVFPKKHFHDDACHASPMISFL